ncbi:hypothetical protein [Edaphobacter bradus]|uniref:hypothetical protein n=1 Tax=Edaphobacter bradus TaxID=2259016 RepID=UPI0021DFEE7B|nr:hypothetical protein [Edaphobacter bradus]
MKSPRLVSTLVSGLFASALAIGMVASTQTAFAQENVLQAKIPFAFQAGSKVMPAGTYRITIQSNHLLILRESTQKTSDVVLFQDDYSLRTPQKSVIAFDRRGDKYFLRHIWTENNNNSIECPKPRAEKRLEVALARTSQGTVTMALNTAP